MSGAATPMDDGLADLDGVDIDIDIDEVAIHLPVMEMDDVPSEPIQLLEPDSELAADVPMGMPTDGDTRCISLTPPGSQPVITVVASPAAGFAPIGTPQDDESQGISLTPPGSQSVIAAVASHAVGLPVTHRADECALCGRACTGGGALEAKMRCQRLCCAAALVLVPYREDLPDRIVRLVQPSEYRRALLMRKALPGGSADKDKLANEVREMAVAAAGWTWVQERDGRGRSNPKAGKVWEHFREQWLLDNALARERSQNRGKEGVSITGIRWAEGGTKNDRLMTFAGTDDSSWQWDRAAKPSAAWRPVVGQHLGTEIDLRPVIATMFTRLQAKCTFRADLDEILHRFEEGRRDPRVYGKATQPAYTVAMGVAMPSADSELDSHALTPPRVVSVLDPELLPASPPKKRPVDSQASADAVQKKHKCDEINRILAQYSSAETRELCIHILDPTWEPSSTAYTPNENSVALHRGHVDGSPQQRHYNLDTKEQRVKQIRTLLAGDDATKRFVEDILRQTTSKTDLEKRVAFVVGINNYAKDKLRNAVSDADLLSECLSSELGFKVTKLTDDTAPGRKVSYRLIREEFDQWLRSIEKGDVAVFAFMGHGIESEGKNYLLPQEQEDEYVTTRAMDVNTMLEEIQIKETRATLFFLDCCRTKPTRTRSTRNVSTGLAEIHCPQTDSNSVLVMFACAPGELSSDGSGQNSPFTETLVKCLPTPGLPLQTLMVNIAIGVRDVTKPPQVPYWNGSIAETSLCLGGGYTSQTGAISFPMPPSPLRTPERQLQPVESRTTMRAPRFTCCGNRPSSKRTVGTQRGSQGSVAVSPGHYRISRGEALPRPELKTSASKCPLFRLKSDVEMHDGRFAMAGDRCEVLQLKYRRETALVQFVADFAERGTGWIPRDKLVRDVMKATMGYGTDEAGLPTGCPYFQDMESQGIEPQGFLRQGETIQVLDRRLDGKNKVKILHTRGWTPLVCTQGRLLLEDFSPEEQRVREWLARHGKTPFIEETCAILRAQLPEEDWIPHLETIRNADNFRVALSDLSRACKETPNTEAELPQPKTTVEAEAEPEAEPEPEPEPEPKPEPEPELEPHIVKNENHGDDRDLPRTTTKRNADGIYDLLIGPVGLTRENLARLYADHLADESYYPDLFRMRVLTDYDAFVAELREQFRFKAGDLALINRYRQTECRGQDEG